jgi:hypothetical protein
MTVSVGGLTAKPLTKAGQVMVAGDIIPSAVYEIVYDGSGFQVFAGSVSGGGGSTGDTVLDLGDANTVAVSTIDGGVMSSSNTTDVLDGGNA